MAKRPWLSLVTVRDFSISAGLDASTFTPGTTDPVGSVTTPEIVLCARSGGSRAIARAARNRNHFIGLNIRISPGRVLFELGFAALNLSWTQIASGSRRFRNRPGAIPDL